MIDDSSIVKNCNLSEDCKIYARSQIRDSVLGQGTIIGDDTIVLFSNIREKVSINRRNYLLRSSIGRYSYTGIGTMIRSAEVGSFCSISWNVSIGGGNHEYDHVTTSPLWRFRMMEEQIDHKKNTELQKRFEDQEPCVIGSDVWIATNVVILRGVTVGHGAVIGAGAVVTRDVEPYSIVVGVPAKPVRKRFDEDTIAALLDIRWWDWPKEVIRENLELIYSTKVDVEVIARLRSIQQELTHTNISNG